MSFNRLAKAALLASLAVPMLSTLPSNAASAAPAALAAPAATASRDSASVESFKATLSAYGSFMMHPRYGEVWVPGVTPPGWHPYPACQWVYAKNVGWYFNDDSEWGKIVHHHGRWQHEAKAGWFWIPDGIWSPGWVSWKMNEKWVGWAPLPPNEDLHTVSADLDTDKLWIFMDAAKFGKGCGGTTTVSNGITTASNVGAVRNVNLFTLPPGDQVDLGIVPEWTTEVITQLITIIIDEVCPPQIPLIPIPLLPRTPDTPETPRRPENPDNPRIPLTPVTPLLPVTPVTPEDPRIPLRPVTPLLPLTPVTPDLPRRPVTPENPRIPLTPVTPLLPRTPDLPRIPILTPQVPLQPILPLRPVRPFDPVRPIKPIPLRPVNPLLPITKPIKLNDPPRLRVGDTTPKVSRVNPDLRTLTPRASFNQPVSTGSALSLNRFKRM